MRDIQTLSKNILNSEFELARSLYELMRSQGYAPLKAAAMIYRYGYLDGKDTQKERISEAYKKLNSLKAEMNTNSLPEATEEGSIQNDGKH